MTNATLTLSDFLLARIAEDERRLSSAGWLEARWWPSKARGEVECEAKRRIVALHGAKVLDGSDDCGFVCRNRACPTLALLALPYADHPDYREAWRP